MASIEEIPKKIDIPPPLPPKDIIRPTPPPKDYPRVVFSGASTISPSTIKRSDLWIASDSESLNSSYTFPGAKRGKKIQNSLNPEPPPPVSIPVSANNLENSTSSRQESSRGVSSRDIFNKIGLWFTFNKFRKAKNETTEETSSSDIVPNFDSDTIRNPNIRRTTSLTDLIRRISTKRSRKDPNQETNTSAHSTPDNPSTGVSTDQNARNNIVNYSTVPSRGNRSKRRNFNTIIDRLTNLNNSRKPFSGQSRLQEEYGEGASSLALEQSKATNKNSKSADPNNSFVEGLELSISSQTLFPRDDDEESAVSTHQSSTAANTMESIIQHRDLSHEFNNTNNDSETTNNYFELDLDVVVPLRDSIAKTSDYSSERADDDTIKGASGTIISHNLLSKDNSNSSAIVGRPAIYGKSQKIDNLSSKFSSSTSENHNYHKQPHSLQPLITQRAGTFIKNSKETFVNTTNNVTFIPTDLKNLTSSNITDTTTASSTPLIHDDQYLKPVQQNGKFVHNHVSPAINDEQAKPERSSIRSFFTKRLYQSFRQSAQDDKRQKTTTDTTATITQATPRQLAEIKKASTLDIGIFQDIGGGALTNGLHQGTDDSSSDGDDDDDKSSKGTLDDGVEGDVSATQSQAPDSSLYTTSEVELSSASKQLSRMSSFAKSYNSDPSAMSTFSDLQATELEATKSDWPVESAWDALIHIAESEKGPARLSNNHLSYVPDHFFDELHHLKALYLDKNSLRELPEELLKLTKLEILDLSNNCISEFNSRFKFKRLKNLRRLNLDNNSLSDITTITKLKALKYLRLNNNFMESLTPEIGRLTKLRFLDLNNNDLGGLPDAIGRLRSLTVLRLNNNHLQSLPSSIGYLRQLQNLDIRANLLTELPESIRELENLSQLDISKNQLKSLPNDITKCTKLTRLDVHENLLETVPGKIGQLSRLLMFNLRQNRLSNLPTDMGKLASLTDLDLSYNDLVILPEELGKLTKLTEIRLNNNPSLLTIPETLKKLLTIKKVRLDNCGLSQIPFELGMAYKKLTYLNISYNSLDNIPKLDGMDKLLILNISNNRIQDLTEQIDQLGCLRELYAAGNKLKNLPKSIGRLKHLEILDVSENLLVGLPLNIGDCQALRKLLLSGNEPLNTLPATLGRLNGLNFFDVGEWPASGFTILQEDKRTIENIKLSPYQQKVPQQVERTLLWRMHDSILKRLRELDNNDAASESVHSLTGAESTNVSQQDVSSGSTFSGQSMTPRDDVILKMVVLKSVYDQIIRDIRIIESDKESSDDATEFQSESGGKKKKFRKLKDFKFLNRGEK